MLAEWPFGASILNRWNDRDATLRWARLPMLLLLLATGLAIYGCAERLAGGWGGAFALCWFATMPVFLTFGPLVLTDTAVALQSTPAPPLGWLPLQPSPDPLVALSCPVPALVEVAALRICVPLW